MGETKARYIIVHGIYPYLRKSLLADLKTKPFTFRFDETTTSQIKKQYDGQVTFFQIVRGELSQDMLNPYLWENVVMQIY